MTTLTSYIGCAGWSLSSAVAASFPGAGSHLERYAAVFDAVEINSSFYRPHQPKTYERWAASTPAHFRFAVKLPKTITHEAGLVGVDDALARFAGEAGALGDKLGCILVQLPPKLALDPGPARALFAALHRRFDCLLACEARHASWFGDSATQLLRDAGVTRVLADPVVAYTGPFVPTAPMAYVRLHGSPRIYYSAYAPQRLADVHAWLAQQAPGSWCIFDNTASGAAVPDALALRAMFG
ncbi:DUF72 domain-containing protein [[Empedobacter] haloabium]|uniref:DUF72 domain-containing protein n=1 Tax=[Empedobacter] haloabium TaxID=592317 RepID=A0ABZ1UTQ4_9BURK